MKKKMFIENGPNFCLVGITPFEKYPIFFRICLLLARNLPNFLRTRNSTTNIAMIMALVTCAHSHMVAGGFQQLTPNQGVGQPATLQLISNFRKKQSK